MLMIRLQRVGRKHEPTFRVVLTDSKNSTKSGRFNEVLGSYDPRFKENTVLDNEKISYWISKGAQPSDTMHNMLVSRGVIKGKKINVLPKKTPIKKEVEEEAATPVEATAPVESAASAETVADESK